jgi:hypothetical protein
MKAFSLAQVADIIEAVREANLTPRQAVKAILGYRANMPLKYALRRAPKGRILESHYRGTENRYHTYIRKEKV